LGEALKLAKRMNFPIIFGNNERNSHLAHLHLERLRQMPKPTVQVRIGNIASLFPFRFFSR
jgi:hypothetical protein